MREDIFIPEHKTKILPLRWFINGVIHRISYYYFTKGLGIYFRDEDGIVPLTPKLQRKMTRYYKMYQILDKPYMRWGTVYKMDPDVVAEINRGMDSSDWDDYDENGHPYWHYVWNEDPVTGDAWRLINNGTSN